ncbi:diacylglycerol kinase family protein [Streptomyces sp. P9(2023)]|uniref:diacylglycerol/lipid kinase family protein n=1 Tax=Streptomyces sp. P9(2023) TaxID=3064394 RepID=UPI0028F3FC99|nr:diacylglycerol kinase family protein [Streptomyces sp. P9(2023)]MDT9686798.1 diacylglycerol kinase family protein [Streptomyces sp. P9(2023)]
MATGAAHARLWARGAVLAVMAAVVVLLLEVGGGGMVIVVGGFVGLVVSAAGMWWMLARRGPLRWLGAFLMVGAPVGVIVLYVRGGLWVTALVVVGLWAVALACGRAALRRPREGHVMRGEARHAPRRAVILMNPASGGGKVARFRLVERAEGLGVRVILLEPTSPVDVGHLARTAVSEGADLLGVAGGDGTQAQVAAVAAEHDLPFLVVPAGTRNHFAMDLGLDRNDPSLSLGALTHGEELRVDLGEVNGRPFVNTVSFGVYAQVVQRPEYRDAKAGTALDAMPDLLRESGPRLDAVTDDGRHLPAQQALLVSNNPYTRPDPFTGRRPRLDQGELGVIGVRVESAAGAADMALRGSFSDSLHVLTAHRVDVTDGDDTMPVAVDGEALTLATPVTCTIRHRALRVRVPRDRPGAPPAAPSVDWRRIFTLAFPGRGDE